MADSHLQFFEGYTLVDITPTGVIRSSDPDDIKRNQQRNWETVLQCLGLKTQPIHIESPIRIIDANPDLFKFGEFYQKNFTVWHWTWACEATGIYDSAETPLGSLMQDFEQVPIICGLEETARFMLPIFYPYGAIKNIYFNRLRNN